MKILYRISDGGNNKSKPEYVNDKILMFKHFINIFKNYKIYVFMDNVKDETYSEIQSIVQNLNNIHLFRTSLGNSNSFMHTLDYAINNFDEIENIYFAEDDYIYKKKAPTILEEGLTISDYVSGYDHPDKYINHSEGGPNPFIKNGGEDTVVMISDSIHWKITNSFCMTFATKVKTIKEDYNIFKNYCNNSYPQDFHIFIDLKNIKFRKLISCIPAVSTHGEILWLSKFVDWNEVFKESFL